MKLFVKGAETTMDMSASAQDHMDRGDCRNASIFALRAAEESGSVRGIMSQVASEIAKADPAQRMQLEKALGIMRSDFEFLQTAREQSLNSFARKCACGTRGASAPAQVTTQPSDGEDDG
jgi:hypothetical protein